MSGILNICCMVTVALKSIRNKVKYLFLLAIPLGVAIVHLTIFNLQCVSFYMFDRHHEYQHFSLVRVVVVGIGGSLTQPTTTRQPQALIAFRFLFHIISLKRLAVIFSGRVTI